MQTNGPIGDGKFIDVLEDGSVQSTGIEGSAGSDTDTSKVDAANMAPKDNEGQVPRYNAKKSASFKPVSVTKNFLAKAGASSTPIKVNNERGKRCGTSGHRALC